MNTNHTNNQNNNNFILNSSNSKNINNDDNSLNNNFENESFRNFKYLLSNNVQSSSSRMTHYPKDSGFLNNNISINNDNNNNRTINSQDISLNENRNYQLKQQQLKNSKILINNFSDNFNIDVISPKKRLYQPICFTSSAHGKRQHVNAQAQGITNKLLINAKIGGNAHLNSDSHDKINNNNKKIEATNPNLEIIKRLSGDDDKDVFGD